MPSLESFDAFIKSTGPKMGLAPDRIINDAAKSTYMLSRMLKGRDAAESVQSGSKIIGNVQLTDVGTAQFADPNEDLEIQSIDALKRIQTNWKFVVDHFTYTDQEVTLNSGDPQTYYTNLAKSKRQAYKTSTFNKMEDALWDKPDNATMETAGGKAPYSIPAFITEDGLAPSGFTTVETLNPTTETGWRNQVEQYTAANIDTELVPAMDKMWHKVRFIAPQGGAREYFENDRLQKMVIATNLDGITKIQSLTRTANDRLVPANNLGWVAGNVMYAGLPIEYVSTLDTALLDSGAAYTAGEPRLFYVNLNYLYPIFHTTMYMYEKPPMPVSARQPFTRVVWGTTWYDLFMVSRKRQGIIGPDA